MSNIAEKENNANLPHLNTHVTITRNATMANINKKQNSGSPVQNGNNELFLYDFEKGFHWNHYYPNGNIDNVLRSKKAKNIKMRMSRMLSKESIDKKKLNRIVTIHTRNRDASSSVLGSRILKTSIKVEEENRGGVSLEKINANEASSSILSRNFDDLEPTKEKLNKLGD